MTLRQLAALFIDQLSGSSKTTDSRLDERDIILQIRTLMNEVMVLKYFEKYQEGDRSPISLYISTYPLQVQHDTDLNRAYVTLPQFYATLPYNRGVHRIWIKGREEEGDVVLSHQPGIGAKVRAGHVPGITYAFMEGFNVVFRNNLYSEPDDEPETVIVQLVIAAPDSIGINDPLPIIPEQQSEILKRLRAMYIPVPVDLAINNNPNV